MTDQQGEPHLVELPPQIEAPPPHPHPPALTRARTPTKPRPVDPGDNKKYQSNVQAFEGALVKGSPLLQTPPDRPVIVQMKRSSASISLNKNKTASAERLSLITIHSGTTDCHSILALINCPPREEEEENLVYLYDPNGPPENKESITCSIGGKPQVVDWELSPHRGVNPEGFCALWPIAVIILWNPQLPRATFDEKKERLKKFNKILIGEGEKSEGRIPGLRKWFIFTMYEILFSYHDLTSQANVSQCITEIQTAINHVLDYSEGSEISGMVQNIVRLFNEKKRWTRKMSDLDFNTYVRKLVNPKLTYTEIINSIPSKYRIKKLSRTYTGPFSATTSAGSVPGGGEGVVAATAEAGGGDGKMNSGGRGVPRKRTVRRKYNKTRKIKNYFRRRSQRRKRYS